jgi:hypothetical protein
LGGQGEVRHRERGQGEVRGEEKIGGTRRRNDFISGPQMIGARVVLLLVVPQPPIWIPYVDAWPAKLRCV